MRWMTERMAASAGMDVPVFPGPGHHQDPLKGSQNLRQRLLLSTLSSTPILIEDIRADATWPGLLSHEVSFLRLLETVSDDCHVEINETGTKLKYKPGIVMGGRYLEHDCGLSRSIGYFLEPLIVLGLFGKKPLSIKLKATTQQSDLISDYSEDLEDTVRPESAAGKISFSSFCYSKGSGPVYNDGLLGVGQSQPNTSFNSHPSEKGYQPRGEVSQPNRYSKAGVLWLPEHGQANSSDNSPNQEDPSLMGTGLPLESAGLLVDIGGTTTCRCERFGTWASIDFLTIGIMLEIIMTVCSPGYGISLIAETTSGCFISVDTTISYPRENDDMDIDEKKELMPPEEVGEEIASLLLAEIEQGGVVDSTHQGLLFLLCALCPQDVSKVRVGKLVPYGIQTLRNIRDFLGVKFVIKPEPSTGTVMLKCIGCGLKNFSRKLS
ncbi:hypothetical protein E3N88_07587 [Mikania micrantha]|uniref:RNA 3'-terminal phosphate cyclase domain-containing protein n=1 Tax=Mikania micrantha TaxID=192012 RepID=A0A5N6PSM6_9ASTR|nr:hypothetical protein E3N88_07587 [Mikania micrantha]